MKVVLEKSYDKQFFIGPSIPLLKVKSVTNSIIIAQYHSVYTIVTSVTHDHLHSIIHTTNYIHIAMHHLRSRLLLDRIFHCCAACLSSCKMSNLLHGPISTNQILPREKRVDRDIFGTSNLQNRTCGVSCDE